ncbi:MAG: hypothetical protein ABI700_02570, partial [Chloroflexota bacterium]
MTQKSRIEVTIAYSAEKDRLVGGDSIQKAPNGSPLLHCLLSYRRAKFLYETAGQLRDIYKTLPPASRQTDNPFGSPMVVLELPSYPVMKDGESVDLSVDELFYLPQLAAAPPEYRQLCKMVLILPGHTTISEAPVRKRKE